MTTIKKRVVASVRGLLAAALAGAATLASAQVMLYEHDGFQGSSFLASADTENLAPLGFNDRVSSVEVRGGTWQLCEDAGYRGQCITLAPGRYASLRPYGMNDRISSLRRAADAGAAAGTPGLELYEHDNYQGRSLAAGDTTPNLAPLGFNDIASSVVVHAGQWQLCEDAEFRGHCITLNPGRYASLNALGMNDRISSVRRVDGTAAAAPAGAPAIELYEHDDFAGRVFRASGPTPNLQPQGFNDIASSVQVRSGRWELCSDAEYRGRCITLEPGSYRHLRERDMNDAVSSLRPLAGNAPAALPALAPSAAGGPTVEREVAGTLRAVFPDGCAVYYNGDGRRTVIGPGCTSPQVREADQAISLQPRR